MWLYKIERHPSMAILTYFRLNTEKKNTPFLETYTDKE